MIIIDLLIYLFAVIGFLSVGFILIILRMLSAEEKEGSGWNKE